MLYEVGGYPDSKSQFLQKACDYGAIGLTSVELANLERAHDEFILSVKRFDARLALKMSPNFPRSYAGKVDFLVAALRCIPLLRKEPITNDGWLSLNWLQFQFDELYAIRNDLAHGAISQSITSPSGKSWILTRYKTGKKRRPIVNYAVEIGDGFLCSVWRTAYEMKHYLTTLTHILDGIGWCWEQGYQEYKEGRKYAEWAMNALSTGVLNADSPALYSLTPQRIE